MLEKQTKELESQIVEETEDKTIVKTFLKDNRGYDVVHMITYYEGDESFEMKNIITNIKISIVK